MYTLPFMREVQRQARPKAVFHALNPAKKLGAPVHLAKPYARGGIVCMDDGGILDSPAPYFKDRAGGTGNTDAYEYAITDALSDPNIANVMKLPDLGYGTDGSAVPASPSSGSSDSNGTGFLGWLRNKHGGITGADWLQAALIGGTGILSGIASSRGNQKAIGSAPRVAPTVSLGYAKGGIVAANKPVNEHEAKLTVQYLLDPDNYSDQSIAAKDFHNVARAAGLAAMSDNDPMALAALDQYKKIQRDNQMNADLGQAFRDYRYDKGGIVCMAGGGASLMDAGQPPAPAAAPGAQDTNAQVLLIQATKAILGQLDPQSAQSAIQAFVAQFGKEALMALVQQVKGVSQQQAAPQGPPQAPMAGGGILRGPGDGMSDSIVANGGRVRVADGEYVVPADAVSQLGNGSTEAGARKLDAGIAKLRRMKYGKRSQPRKLPSDSNPILGQ